MDIESFRACCERRLPAALDFLRAMVAVNSFTANATGVDAVGRLVEEEFAALGFAAARVPGPAGCGEHLFLRGERRPGRPTLALVSHLDTVFPPEEERRNNFIWRREGERIYGPGTSDIKGGTALVFLVLAAMRETAPELYAETNWIVALNACEEVDSAHFGAACAGEFPADAVACLIFESDGGEEERYSLVTARKGRATFRVRAEGRGAHAGGSHAEGVNAIVLLAEAVTKLATLTDYAADVTVNVGTISGGTVINRVPHEAEAALEMRAFDRDVYERAKAAILGLGGGRVRVTLEDETPPWPRNEGTERLIGYWRRAGSDVGLRVACEARGGLSDGNVLWGKFPTLDGLGPRGGNAHCSERDAAAGKEPEWVDAASFVPKALLNARAIELLLADQAAETQRGA